MTAITFYSDDKKILQKFLDLALKLNVKTEMQPVDDNTAFYADFIEAIKESNAKTHHGQSLSDFLNEVETELETEKQLSYAH